MKVYAGVWRVRCPQCEALAINGQPCHETGCPLSNKPWIYSQENLEIIPAEYFRLEPVQEDEI